MLLGPKTERQILEGLERASAAERARPRRGLLLNRAWALLEPLADALGGVVAGDPRRFRETSERLVIVSSDNNALDRFETLPEIVAVVERGESRVVGLTVEGTPVQLVVAEPGRFGTELLRATGSKRYVDATRATPAE